MKLPRHKKAIEAKVVFGTQKPKCNAFDQSRRGAGISGQVYRNTEDYARARESSSLATAD